MSNHDQHSQITQVLTTPRALAGVHTQSLLLSQDCLHAVLFDDTPVAKFANAAVPAASAVEWLASRRWKECHGPSNRHVCLATDACLRLPLDTRAFLICKAKVPSLNKLAEYVQHHISIPASTSAIQTKKSSSLSLSSMAPPKQRHTMSAALRYQEAYIDFLIYMNYRLSHELKSTGFKISWREESINQFVHKPDGVYARLSSDPVRIRRSALRGQQLQGDNAAAAADDDNDAESSVWSTDMLPVAQFVAQAAHAHVQGKERIRLDSEKGVLLWSLLEHEVMLKLLHNPLFDNFKLSAHKLPRILREAHQSRIQPLQEDVNMYLISNAVQGQRREHSVVSFTSFDIHCVLAGSFAAAMHDAVCLSSPHRIDTTRNLTLIAKKPSSTQSTNNNVRAVNVLHSFEKAERLSLARNRASKDHGRLLLEHPRMKTHKNLRASDTHDQVLIHTSASTTHGKKPFKDPFTLHNWEVFGHFDPPKPNVKQSYLREQQDMMRQTMQTQRGRLYKGNTSVNSADQRKTKRITRNKYSLSARGHKPTTRSAVSTPRWQRWNQQEMTQTIRVQNDRIPYQPPTPFRTRQRPKTVRQHRIQNLKKWRTQNNLSQSLRL